MELDHVIVPVTDAQRSLRFYTAVLPVRHEGRYAGFEVLRINPGLTFDLLQVPAVGQPAHFALRVARDAFERVLAGLRAAAIPFGGSPFERGGAPARQFGALGWADAFYFWDPDGHNIEIRAAGAHAG